MRLSNLRALRALCLLVLCTALNASGNAEEARPKRVLIISTGSRFAPGFILADQQILRALAKMPSGRIETYAENLDLVRFPNERYQQIFRDYLAGKYADNPPDLVILVFVGNLGIPAQLLPKLFTGTPIIAAGLTEEEIHPDQFGGLIGGVAQRLNPGANFELILRLQPEVRRVVVIGGTAEIDRQVLQRVREAAAPFKERIAIDFWDNRTIGELRQAVKGLPPETVILFARMFRDGAGQAVISAQVGERIGEWANVPVYVMFDSAVGAGAVGGAVASIEAFAKRAGEQAVLVLGGADIKSLPFETRSDSVPTFDWRALKRWGIPESRLPPGSVVLFKPLSIGEQYFWQIIAALVIIVIQAAMIIDLVLHRARRRRVETELRESRQLMELATSAGDLGLWSRDLTGGGIWANAPMRSLFGFGAQEALRFDDLVARVNPSDRERMLSEVEHAQTAGLPFQGEFRVLLPNGTERWVLAKGRTVADPGGSGDERRMGVVTEITERKKAENALRESENLLTEAQSIAHLGGWQWDMLTGRNIWSAENYRLFGYEPGAVEPSYDVWFDRIHPDDRSRVLDHLQAVCEGRTSYDIEYRVIHPNGETRHVHCLGEVFRDANGAPERMAGTVLDITERKRTEEKFQSAVEASPNAIVMIDDQGRILLVNTQGEKLFAYAREELLGQSVEMVVPELFCNGHLAHRANFLATPQARNIGGNRELFGLRKDGSEVPIEIGLSPMHTGEGLITLTTIVDISERKRVAVALAKERAFLLQVIDIDPNFIFAKDIEGRFTLANQAVADAYGTTVENLIGKTDVDFNLNSDEVESFRRADLEVIATLHDRFIAEEHFTDARGRLRWFQTMKRPILDKDGRSMQVLTASSDITLRKETEIQLQEQRAELAHVARISIMGELAASLAHELNQPLTAILSNAQAALRFMNNKPADLQEVREILQDIVKDNSRAGEVIRRMRALAKKEELELVPLDLASLIRDVVTLVHSDAILQNVRVTYELDADLPLVRGDRVQLQQVVLNLLLNAFDAMKDCPANKREAKLRAGLRGTGLIQLTLSDRGTGLSGDKLDKIFQPFYTTKREGLGMGLSICRSIVEAHGGRLWAESNADHGATFYFTVPVGRGMGEGSVVSEHNQ